MRKVSDIENRFSYCMNPNHNPPGNIVLKPGVYEHTCPGCKKAQTVIQQEGGRL
jgi:hypothetical protein